MSLAQRFSAASARAQDIWARARASDAAQKYGRWVQRAAFAALIAYLVYRLSEIGWRDTLANMPTAPGFYLVYVLIYFLLPTSEAVIYRLLLGVDPIRNYHIFVRKRVFNEALVGYSGEASLIYWAKTRFDVPLDLAFSRIKDNNILSTVASYGAMVLLVGGLFATGAMQKAVATAPFLKFYVWLAVALAVAILPAFAVFRRRVVKIGAGLAALVLAIHLARLTSVLGLQALQWHFALPAVAFQTWAIFLSIELILSRIPFLPNIRVLLLGAGLSLTALIDAPEAAVAGMFLAAAALSQIMNFAMFVVTSFAMRGSRAAGD